LAFGVLDSGKRTPAVNGLVDEFVTQGNIHPSGRYLHQLATSVEIQHDDFPKFLLEFSLPNAFQERGDTTYLI